MAMTTIRFTGESYETKASDQNYQQTINWYPVEDFRNGKYQGQDPNNPAVALYPTPGLKSPFVTLAAGGVVRALLEHRGIMYAVAANKFYSINTAGTATEEGTLATSTGRVIMTARSDEVMLIDGTNGYTYVVSTDTFTTITDLDFPDTTTQVTMQDEYFIVEDPLNKGRFYVSDVADGLSWGTAAFATAEGAPDDLIAIVSSHRELFLIGEYTTEIWINTGAATVTFERRDGVFIDVGCQIANTVAKGDNSFFWLAQDKNGGNVVVRLNGITPQIISNRAVSYQISTYATISDAFAFVYRQEGHEFYVLTFPTEKKTWVYDSTIGLWHERASLESAAQHRWRPNCHAFFNGKNYVGDFNSGKIYQLDTSTYTDNGSAITRTRTTQSINANGRLFSIGRLQVDFESGVGADDTVNLSFSKDGGNSFVTGIDRTIDTSEAGSRVLWNRLGSMREITFKLTTTANAEITVLGALADIQVGEE